MLCIQRKIISFRVLSLPLRTCCLMWIRMSLNDFISVATDFYSSSLTAWSFENGWITSPLSSIENKSKLYRCEIFLHFLIWRSFPDIIAQRKDFFKGHRLVWWCTSWTGEFTFEIGVWQGWFSESKLNASTNIYVTYAISSCCILCFVYVRMK